MRQKLNMRYVNCTEGFLQAAGLGMPDTDATALEIVRNFVDSQFLLRFLLQLGALLPLAICVAVSLNKKVGLQSIALRSVGISLSQVTSVLRGPVMLSKGASSPEITGGRRWGGVKSMLTIR